MRKICLLTMLLLGVLGAMAQVAKGKATVTITNEGAAVVEGASVELLRSTDSALVKATLTDKSGVAEFENIALGSYLVKATMVGFAPQYSTSFILSETQPALSLPALSLKAKAATELGGVTVTARKPFIQKLNDRIVVNVENSVVSAGSSALDVLERSPGITVDQNDAISLRGRSGVIIM
ncbi:MAG TPA: carboxypeptidase-like regulatory domain-containing protein, partial [Chitinophagaceae bacterium]